MGAKPPAGSSGFTWKKAYCTPNDNGVMIKIGSIRTEVKSVPHTLFAGTKTRYYQLVKVQIDRRTSGSMWRKVQLKKYDWSRFTTAQLPTYATSAVRTGMGHDAGMFSAKATVLLKRVIRGPDRTVSKYTTRSRSFSCGLAPTSQLPSGGGGLG